METVTEPSRDTAVQSHSDDPLLEALDELVAAARANMSAWTEMMGRVEQIRELRRQGVPYAEMDLGDNNSPPVIDVLAKNQERLSAAGARYRRAAVRPGGNARRRRTAAPGSWRAHR